MCPLVSVLSVVPVELSAVESAYRPVSYSMCRQTTTASSFSAWLAGLFRPFKRFWRAFKGIEREFQRFFFVEISFGKLTESCAKIISNTSKKSPWSCSRSPWDEPLLLLFAVCLLCSGSFFASLWVCSYMQISKKDGIVRESIRIRSFWFCPDRTTGGKKLAKQLARQMRIQRLVQQWTFTCEHNEHAVPQASTECWRVSQSDREKCASRLGRRARSDAAQIIAEHCKNTTKHPRVKRKVVDSEAWPPCEGLETTQSTTEHRRSPQERSRIRKYHNGWNPADYRRAPQSTAEQHRELQPNLPQSTIQYCRFVFSSFPCLLFFCCFLPYKAGKTVRQVKPNCSRP